MVVGDLTLTMVHPFLVKRATSLVSLEKAPDELGGVPLKLAGLLTLPNHNLILGVVVAESFVDWLVRGGCANPLPHEALVLSVNVGFASNRVSLQSITLVVLFNHVVKVRLLLGLLVVAAIVPVCVTGLASTEGLLSVMLDRRISPANTAIGIIGGEVTLVVGWSVRLYASGWRGEEDARAAARVMARDSATRVAT